MAIKFAGALCIVWLVSCAVAYPPAVSSATTTPNGGHGYWVGCPAELPGRCYEEASKRCPSGYKPISQYGGDRSFMMVIECHE